MTERPEQSRSARARDYHRVQAKRQREEAAAGRRVDRAVARQRQLGVAGIAFKAGFFGALGVAVASLIMGILGAIFWLLVFGAI